MKKNRSKSRKGQRNLQEIERSARAFWGGVFLVGFFAVVLMYVAMA